MSRANRTKSNRHPVTSTLSWEEHLAELRRLVMECSDLSHIIDYFLVHLAEQKDFVRASEAVNNDRLTSFLGSVLRATYGQGPLISCRWMRTRGDELWHAALMALPDTLVLALYFRDLNRGVMVASRLRAGPTHYMRFAVPPMFDPTTGMQRKPAGAADQSN